MAVEMITIARPYAKAIYRLAEQKEHCDKWAAWLSSLKPLLAHKPFLDDLLHPSRTREQQVVLLLRWVGEDSGALRRFLMLLAERNRLTILPAICDQYQALLAKRQQLLRVRIVSAFPLSDALQQQLITWLTSKWGGQDIQADYEVDRALLGGVEISTQDGSRVLRLSMRHQLQQLKQALLG